MPRSVKIALLIIVVKLRFIDEIVAAYKPANLFGLFSKVFSYRMFLPGEVQEWLNWTLSKSVVRLARTVGSNPTLSAIQNALAFVSAF